MSRNYVDPQGDLIPIAGKGIGVAEWGEPQSITFPYTATKDGIIVVSVNPSSGNASYLIIDDSNGKRFANASTGGGQYNVVIPTKKGLTYTIVSSGNTRTTDTFYPFKENNDLQMVREKYSTEETVIGEWIDGKPIYRKVIMGNNTQYYDLSTCNIKDIMNMDAFCDNRSGAAKDCFMYSMDAKNSESIVYQEQNKRLYVASVSNLIKYIIIEYTKTTD